MIKNNNLKQKPDVSTRSQNMLKEVTSNKKIQHKMTDFAPDFMRLQDLYCNSFIEWLKHPKCEIVLNSKGKE